jgi:hypothetical protein
MAWASAILVAITTGMVSTLVDTIETKFDSSDSSIGVCFDQVDVIAKASTHSPANALFAHGIHPAPKDAIRGPRYVLDVHAVRHDQPLHPGHEPHGRDNAFAGRLSSHA